LLIGKNAGHFILAALVYLRIARGTLADAQTSTEELYDWEFDGPFICDFTGREATRPATPEPTSSSRKIDGAVCHTCKRRARRMATVARV